MAVGPSGGGGVAVGNGVAVGAGVLVGTDVGGTVEVGAGVGACVGLAVAVGSSVGTAVGRRVGRGVAVGTGVAVPVGQTPGTGAAGSLSASAGAPSSTATSTKSTAPKSLPSGVLSRQRLSTWSGSTGVFSSIDSSTSRDGPTVVTGTRSGPDSVSPAMRTSSVPAGQLQVPVLRTSQIFINRVLGASRAPSVRLMSCTNAASMTSVMPSQTLSGSTAACV